MEWLYVLWVAVAELVALISEFLKRIFENSFLKTIVNTILVEITKHFTGNFIKRMGDGFSKKTSDYSDEELSK